MALITRSADASVDASTAMVAEQITGLLAGEDLDPAAPCYIKSSDGKVYMTDGTSDNEAAHTHGFSARGANSGEPITLYGRGTRFRYGSSLTIGAPYYGGATAGRLDTAATTGGDTILAYAVTATDIVVAGLKFS